jgi:hypothetical protein
MSSTRDEKREDRWVTFGLLQQVSFSANADRPCTQVNFGCLAFSAGELLDLPVREDFEGGITFFFEDFGQFPPIPHKIIILDHTVNPIGFINRADFSCDVTTNKTNVELFYMIESPSVDRFNQLPSWIKRNPLNFRETLHER